MLKPEEQQHKQYKSVRTTHELDVKAMSRTNIKGGLREHTLREQTTHASFHFLNPATSPGSFNDPTNLFRASGLCSPPCHLLRISGHLGDSNRAGDGHSHQVNHVACIHPLLALLLVQVNQLAVL